MEIDNYQKKWDKIIGSYDGDFRSDEDVDKFFTGEFYKNSNQEKRLYENALPEPYLGNPKNCSIVCLNLNPGQYLKEFQDPIDGIFVKKGGAIKSYSSFAKTFPYLDNSLKIKNDEELNKGHKWWESRNRYFNRIFNYNGSKLPFALEICPWRSSKFGGLKYNKEFLEYVEKNVFDLASQVSFNSDLKIVFSVGAPFRRIFEKLPNRFNKIREITQKNASESGFTYPRKNDGKLVNRRISIWLDTKYNVRYINTSAQGGNKNPSRHFDGIIQELIAQT